MHKLSFLYNHTARTARVSGEGDTHSPESTDISQAWYKLLPSWGCCPERAPTATFTTVRREEQSTYQDGSGWELYPIWGQGGFARKESRKARKVQGKWAVPGLVEASRVWMWPWKKMQRGREGAANMLQGPALLEAKRVFSWFNRQQEEVTKCFWAKEWRDLNYALRRLIHQHYVGWFQRQREWRLRN